MKSVIDFVLSDLKVIWKYMLTYPWSDTKTSSGNRSLHAACWIVGWIWAIAGIFLGAFVAPSLIEHSELANNPNHDYLIIAISALSGFTAQLVGWLPLIVILPLILRFYTWVYRKRTKRPSRAQFARRRLKVIVTTLVVFAPLPLVAIGYGLYRYIELEGAHQGIITFGVLGGLAVKTLLIPIINSIIVGSIANHIKRKKRR